MLVSVIIPCYNVEDYLAAALESALTQDYPHIEIICVDNNSTDNTRSILENYTLRYPHKITLLSEPKQNASAARNRGWRAGHGEWIQFLDADDILLPDKISRQIALCQKTTRFMVGTPIYEDLQGKQVSLSPWKDPWKGLAHGMFSGQTSANLYHRNGMAAVNGWNENLPDTQDTELMFRLLANNQNPLIDIVPSCICRDRVSGKITQQDPVGILVRHLRLRQRMNLFLEREKATYWADNHLFFHLAMYRLLRMLSVHTVDKSAKLYKELLPPNFKVKASKPLRIPVWNALSVRVFGFRNVENLKNNLKRIFPAYCWAFLKKIMRGFNC